MLKRKKERRKERTKNKRHHKGLDEMRHHRLWVERSLELAQRPGDDRPGDGESRDALPLVCAQQQILHCAGHKGEKLWASSSLPHLGALS